LITARDNARLKLVRRLRQRKHRDETGLFVAEGEDLVAAAAEAGIGPVELLVAGDNVRPELLAEISALPHPARVIGVYRRSDLSKAERDVVLALWQVADPGNVGTLLRTADGFGAGVALSAGCADPLGPKAVRASAGAVFRVPLLSWDALPRRRVALVAHGGQPLAEVDLTPPLALLLGAEREGLPPELVTDCYKATIPLPGGAESLNVAAAGAIALYELSRRGSS
jgi:TrmH family RNA methyltransferase